MQFSSLRFTKCEPGVSSREEVETGVTGCKHGRSRSVAHCACAPFSSAKSGSSPILTTYGSFHQKAVLLKRINVIWSVHSHLQKYFRSSPKQITSLVASSRPTEGRIAIVTNAGRDAVDADVLLTNSTDADGEVVWS